jgi:TonB family protein
MTIVETLTQRLPSWRREAQGDPEVPGNLTEPLLSVVRNCLRRDARRRWTVKEIGERLNPAETGSAVNAPEPEITEPAVASAASSEAKKPAAAEPVKPAATIGVAKSMQSAKVPTSASAAPSSYAKPSASSKTTAPKRGSFPLVVIILAALAAFAGYKFLHQSPAAPESSAQTQTPAESALNQNVTPPEQGQQAPSKNLGSTSAAPPKETPANSARSRPTATPTEDAGVLHQVLPDVPEKAARTIHGRFHVIVNATTDSSGSVTNASLDSAGPSQYFANLALKAARQWKFAAGNGGPSDWLIRFDFTAAGTTASAKPSR